MSTPRLFDVHTHIQFQAFKDDAEAVVKRALDSGVWLVNVGTQKDTSAYAVEIANKFSEGVWASVGLHPIHTGKSHHDPQELDGEKGFTSRGEEFDYGYYKKLVENPKVVAIGECGLDYYRLEENTKKRQQDAFLKQIELSHEVGKPLMVHCRNGSTSSPQSAFGDLTAILKTNKSKLKISNSGIAHFFTGNKEDAEKLLDLGFSFSFGGVITFAREYDEVIKYLPLDRILLETDAPYVAPVPYRGKRNEPLFVAEVSKKIAELKNIPQEKAALITFENAIKILNPK